jgi:uncharacterized membrane protein
MNFPARASRGSKLLTAFLGVVVLAVIGGIVYFSLGAPGGGKDSPQFYLVGEGGTVGGYPRQFKAGEPAAIRTGIINGNTAATYEIRVNEDGTPVGQLISLSLVAGQTWEGEITITPAKAGNGQVLMFYLYRDGGSQPCVPPLKLTVDVVE